MSRTSVVMSPQYFRSDVVYARFILSSNSNNCCWLYFNANIVCSFTKKLQPPDPLPLDPAGGLPSPRTPVFFYVPTIILWHRRPGWFRQALIYNFTTCTYVVLLTAPALSQPYKTSTTKLFMPLFQIELLIRFGEVIERI